MMQHSKIGQTDLVAPPIVLGGNVFGWTLDEKESFRILDAALDSGLDVIDTANSYSHWAPGNSGGESETIIGKWLQERGNRNKVTLLTKVGSGRGRGKNNLSKSHIISEVEKSLWRLKTDYIDLYFTHHDDLLTPVEETLEAYYRLIQEGKVRYIGASNISPERFRRSQQTATERSLVSYQCLQPEYNLYARYGFEHNWKKYVQETGIGVLTYYSLASGFLTGKYRSADDLNKSVRGTNVKSYLNQRGFRILDALQDVADQYQSNLAEVSLAWLHNKPYITAAIASATSEGQLETLRKSADLKLDESAILKLDEASVI